MFYEIENHARAHLRVLDLKRQLRAAEGDLKEHETHHAAQRTTERPKAVIVDDLAVTLDRKGPSAWEYTVGEVVA